MQTKVIVEVLVLHLHNLQVSSEGSILALLRISDSPGNLGVLGVGPGPHMCDLNIAVMDFLLGMLHLEVLVRCLSVGKGGPWS